MFDTYREDVANSPDTVGPEGSEEYFTKLGVDLEGLDAFVVMEIIQAPTMGEMSREGFVDGWLAPG
jgi:DCN1-like protein 1/2